MPIIYIKARGMAEEDQLKQQVIKSELGYTNEDNPFGDKNLTKQFVWKKKVSKVQQYQSDSDSEEDNKNKRQKGNFQSQIDKIKQQRKDREIEKQKMEEEKQRAQKERDDEQFQIQMEKQKQFQKDQIKIRALIRMNYGSEKPIDTLVKVGYVYRGLIPFENRFNNIMNNMEDYIKQQGLDEIHVIVDESKVQFQNSQEQNNELQSYWESIIIIGNQIIDNHKYLKGDVVRQNVLTKEFLDEVKEMYEGKTIQELVELETEIEQTLQGNEFGVMDYEYWENILKYLRVQKAKQVLEKCFIDFEKNTKQKTLELSTDEMIRQQQQEEMEEEEREKLFLSENTQTEGDGYFSPRQLSFTVEQQRKLQILTQEENDQQIQQINQIIFDKQLKEALEQLQVYQKQQEKEKEDQNFLSAVSNFEKMNDDLYMDGLDSLTQQMIEHTKNQRLEDGEEVFDEVANIKQGGSSGLKRPQYFNRVRMGYDWNKYNQAHFDQDNPPPRIIQGYKFNIFYPELIDKSKAPEYFLEKCEDSSDFFIIRFSAGPPYEDIAFKILNKEWDLGDKKGFKCVFSKKILHLYFNFKRNRYRR